MGRYFMQGSCIASYPKLFKRENGSGEVKGLRPGSWLVDQIDPGKAQALDEMEKKNFQAPVPIPEKLILVSDNGSLDRRKINSPTVNKHLGSSLLGGCGVEFDWMFNHGIHLSSRLHCYSDRACNSLSSFFIDHWPLRIVIFALPRLDQS